LSYVVIGAALVSEVDLGRLAVTLVAFFAAVGVAAHALDERHGRPLGTQVPTLVLDVVATAGLVVAIALGMVGVVVVGWWLAPFVVIGPVLAVGYNLELFGGCLHNRLGFALAWGAFPVLTAYVAQASRLDAAAVVAAGAATALSLAQRTLSTPARTLRRRVRAVQGHVHYSDGGVAEIDETMLLGPLERTLRLLSWSTVLIAVALLGSRLT
jgi:hypothetical protein